MLGRFLLVLAAAVGSVALTGCDGGREPTSTKPQAPNQRAKTQDERIDYLIAMLHRKNSAKKNAQAARTLSRIGTAAEKAIPDLEQVMTEHKDPEVQEAAREAIATIQAAAAMEQ